MTTPTPPGGDDPRRDWRDQLSPAPECLTIEQLAEADLDTAARAHIAACARCEAERALWLAADSAETEPGEGAAVQWVARETRRRIFPDTEREASSGRWLRVPRWALSLAAGAAIVIGGYAVLRSPSPTLPATAPGSVYRSTRVDLLLPIGDLVVPPERLAWRAVDGAARYQVRVLEVDGAEIWTTVTTQTSLPAPEVVTRAALPARTLTWRVTALDANDRAIGEAGVATFRVSP